MSSDYNTSRSKVSPMKNFVKNGNKFPNLLCIPTLSQGNVENTTFS